MRPEDEAEFAGLVDRQWRFAYRVAWAVRSADAPPPPSSPLRRSPQVPNRNPSTPRQRILTHLPPRSDVGSGNAAQWQYLDVGVNFDVWNPKEVGEKLSFDLTADVSSLATPENGGPNAVAHPVIRQNRWQSNVIIVPGKPTAVFLADDLDSKGKMQVEVTATRVE